MAIDMYLDPKYAELIVEVNKLKIEVAEKITERDWLSTFIFPEIKHNYNLKLGANEAELYLAKLNLDKLKRKIVLYKETIKYDNTVNEEKLDKIIDKEFKNEIHEYKMMQEDIEHAIEYTHKEKVESVIVDKLNYLYKNLILKLSPLINFKNTRLENELYDILEESYKKCDYNKMLGIKALCDTNHINSELELDDIENMEKLKKVYTNLLEENRCIVLNIRSSEMYSNRTILNSEVLLRRKKDEINKKIVEITDEYSMLLKEFDKLKKKK